MVGVAAVAVVVAVAAVAAVVVAAVVADAGKGTVVPAAGAVFDDELPQPAASTQMTAGIGSARAARTRLRPAERLLDRVLTAVQVQHLPDRLTLVQGRLERGRDILARDRAVK